MTEMEDKSEMPHSSITTIKLRTKAKCETNDSSSSSFLKRISKFINVKKPLSQRQNKKNDQLELGRLNMNDLNKSKPTINRINDDIFYSVQRVGVLAKLFDFSIELQCCTIIGKELFIATENNADIFILTFNETSQELEIKDKWNPLLKDVPLYPLQIKSDQAGNIYLSAYYYPKTNEDEKFYLLVKYDRDFQLLIKTKKYNFPRFSDFDFDSDGLLVVISSSSKENNSVYHVSKLTENFNKFSYKFNFSSATSKYQPHKILCSGIDNKSWIVAFKIENNKRQPRLISFSSTTVRDEGESMQSFMGKISTAAWSSENFYPIAICKLTSKYSLTIDDKTKSLYLLSWHDKNNCPDVVQVSNYGEPYFKALCSNLNGMAYLFTHNSIYKFSTALINENTK